ncbi:MAG: efflux transporter outer membrane subunit [Caenibius sp.]
MMRRVRFLPAVALTALLAACAGNLAEPRLAPVTSSDMGLGGETAPAIPAAWWTDMGDAQLDRIMSDALESSPDLSMAMARLDAARATLDMRRSDGRPQVDVDGDEQRTRLSEHYIIPPPYGGSTQWMGQIQANLSWTLDFWGKQATAVRQASASAKAAALDADAARLALTGAVAQTYVELVRAERIIAVTRTRIAERQNALQLTNARVRARLASQLDAEAVRTELSRAEQELVRAQSQRSLAVHALAALAGRGVDYYDTIGPATLNLDSALPVPTVLPADLLARRPDIAAALARIEAARQGRELARKAYYPDINLAGLVGVQALGLDKLFTGGAVTYGGGAAIHLPIFNGGRLRAEHGRATADLDTAIADYNGQVVRAVRDAADALTSVSSSADDLTAQRNITHGLSETRRLNRIRMNSGLDSRLDIVASELRLLEAEVATANLEAESVLARIRLLVALGGDFPTSAPASSSNPPERKSDNG